MRLQKFLYNSWVLLTLTIIYLTGFSIQLILLQFKKTHPASHTINLWMCKICATIWGIKTKISFSEELNPNSNYIFCPNHTSNFDIIAIMVSLKGQYSFIGKSSLTKVPLFGYMYSKLYIAVDRKNRKSRGEALMQSKEVLDNNKSLIIFPEGGIPSTPPPEMISFKNGAFILALEKKTSIVPVTIINTWNVFPDNSKFINRNFTINIIYHKPIKYQDFKNDDIELLKIKTRNTINVSLLNYDD